MFEDFIFYQKSYIFEEIKMIGKEMGGVVLSRSAHVMDGISLPPPKVGG